VDPDLIIFLVVPAAALGFSLGFLLRVFWDFYF
jgi:hypothetical protein